MENKNFKMDNLRKLREKKNMTQTRLSVEIEVSQEIISHYEIGESKPNIDNLLKIADFFHCSTDYLLNRTDNPAMIKDIDKNSVSIYIGIPFCPTRCLYCSFVSTDINVSGKYMSGFVEKLLLEIDKTSEILKKLKVFYQYVLKLKNLA